jgi:release factor glutamine methyltransferase
MNVQTAFAHAARRLAEANVDSPRREARLLAALAIGDSAARLSAAPAELSSNEAESLAVLVARRAAREPFAYIAGRKEFWSIEFEVGPGVLVPRPETETLIEEFCRSFPGREEPLRIVDLGTGSGCLLIAALSEFPHAHGTGLERSAEALDWARRNVVKHDLASRANLQLGDWKDEIAGSFDAILANPPYIPHRNVMALTPEVARYEPSSALDGGADGLDAFRALAPQIARLLKPRGAAFLEIGEGQTDKTREILEAAGLTVNRIAPDLAGIPRCLVASLRCNRSAEHEKTVGKSGTTR